MNLKSPAVSGRVAASRVPPEPRRETTHGDQATALRLWKLLHACTTLVEQELRRRLHDDFATSHPRFALMAELARVPGGLRMGELSRRLKVAAGSVTTLADQLEREGVVLRTRSATDRRVQTLALTPGGHTLLAAMAAEHDRWVAAMLGGVATGDAHALVAQLGALEQVLAAMVSGKRVRPAAARDRRMASGADAVILL